MYRPPIAGKAPKAEARVVQPSSLWLLDPTWKSQLRPEVAEELTHRLVIPVVKV